MHACTLADGLSVPALPTLQRVGDRSKGRYDGNNSPMVAPHTGSPAITVPMGFTGTGGGCWVGWGC